MLCLPGDGEDLQTAGVKIAEAQRFPYEPYNLTSTVKYVPKLGDIVVGVVTGKYADSFKINLNASQEGHLSCMAFQNATRQHFPSIQVGSVVLCGISSCSKDYDVILTCIAAEDSKSWTTNETYLGELSDGYFFDVPLWFSEILLADRCLALSLWGERVPFEIAVGCNGRVWVKASSIKATASTARFIQRSVWVEISAFNRVISNKAASTTQIVLALGTLKSVVNLSVDFPKLGLDLESVSKPQNVRPRFPLSHS